MTMASLTDMAVARVTGEDTHRDVHVVATLDDRGVERVRSFAHRCRLGTLTLIGRHDQRRGPDPSSPKCACKLKGPARG
jgi:hypothetical protein